MGLYYFDASITSVDIPQTVNEIGARTFYGCKKLTSIVLPEGVPCVGDSMFYSCSAITSVTLPQTITSIGVNAFYHCNLLKTVTLPDAVEEIHERAFNLCYGMTTVTTPANLKRIDYRAFDNCTKLKAMTLPASLTSDTFKEGFAEGLRFMIANEGPYLMHCSEGKDRVGLTSAVLEALMGASLEEIRDDYAKSYTNLYDVKDGRQQPLDPEVLAAVREIIVRNLSASFGIEDLSSADLAEAAENYLLGIGLSAEEIARLKAVLS